MRKLSRIQKPRLFHENEEKWRIELYRAISKYEGYSNIPNKIKKQLLKPASDSNVALIRSMNNGKCAYCETAISSASFVHVDHFVPKSIYPNVAFSWKNFLPACHVCNTNKGHHNTIAEPILNPYLVNPDEYIQYVDGDPVPAESCPDSVVTQRTIDLLDLKRKGLSLERFRIQETLIAYKCDLHEALQKHGKASRNKKAEILDVIRTTLDMVERLSAAGRPHSQFVSCFLKTNMVIQQARDVLGS